MSEPTPPSACPSCGSDLVARVHGPWCPRCRGWIILRELARWEAIEGFVSNYAWAVQIA